MKLGILGSGMVGAADWFGINKTRTRSENWYKRY